MAMAVAQGIGYQYTSSGDALASGARERWGGAVSGSIPYSYAMTSDSLGGGIASIYWPSFAVTEYKNALPLLADNVPFVGLKTPDAVLDTVKVTSGSAPAYPFVASTSGAKAGEYTVLPATPIPGGSITGATGRCTPESAAVHCFATITKAQLIGGPTNALSLRAAAFQQAVEVARTRLAGLGRHATPGSVQSEGAPAPSVAVQGIDTVAEAVSAEHQVKSFSLVTVQSFDILDSIHLGNIRATATNVTNGSQSDVKRTVAVGEASIAGQKVTINNDGVALVGNTAMKPGDYDNANKQLNDALSAAGITIRLFGGKQTKEERGVGTSDEGEGLYIGLKLPEPGVPNSFFYLNYWVGATLNTATGTPSSVDTATEGSGPKAHPAKTPSDENNTQSWRPAFQATRPR